MQILILKTIVAGLIVALASGIATKYPYVGAVIGTFPLVTILTFIFLIVTENPERASLQNYALSVTFMATATVVYPTCLYLLLRFTDLSGFLVLIVSLGPVFIAYQLMYLGLNFLKPIL
jgi:hypothetical protein